MCYRKVATYFYNYFICWLDLLNSNYRVDIFCWYYCFICLITYSLLFEPFYLWLLDVDCSIYLCAFYNSSVSKYTCSFNSSIIISFSSITLLHLAICSLNSPTVLSYFPTKFSYFIVSCSLSESWDDVDRCNLYNFYVSVFFSFSAYFMVCDLSSLKDSIFWL